MGQMLERVYNHYTNHGLISLLKSSVGYVYSYYLARPQNLAESVEIIRPPKTIDATYNGVADTKKVKHISNSVGPLKIDPRLVYSFDNVSIVSNNGNSTVYTGTLPFDPLTTHANINYLPKLNWKFYIYDLFTKSKTPDSRAAILISEKHELGYSHWLTEVVSQLSIIHELGYSKKQIDIILICGGNHKKTAIWQIESLEILNLVPDFVNPGGPLYVSKLFVPSYSALASKISSYPQPSDLRWIRERANNLIKKSTNGVQRLYISRQKSGRRKISNLTEIEKILTDYEFEIIHPENLSFKEQIELFASAEVILGPHGGGLMNMIFATDALVIELLANHESCHHQFVLSNMLDHDYEFILCETVENSHNNIRHRDLIVDPGNLASLLEIYCN